MQHHFLQITQIQDAVIRGDLSAVRSPARELGEMNLPAGMPPTSQPFMLTLRMAGRRAADAKDLVVAASAAASLLADCGECHRTVGFRPAIDSARQPNVGGIVGHMLEHQRAVRELQTGLFAPSTTDWERGAATLRAAPLSRSDLSLDPKLTAAIREAETRVHRLADSAAKADTMAARTTAYAAILTTCADCHTLHKTVWGPTGR